MAERRTCGGRGGIAASTRGRGVADAFAALLVGAALAAGVLAPAVLSGCGEAATRAPARPFGSPPPAVPGIHAWAAGEPGVLLVTADGGASWERRRFYVSERGVDVAFPDARNGWLLTESGVVLLTADGGAAWEVVGKTGLRVKALAAVDAGHAWVAGNAAGTSGSPGTAVVLHTSDGGSAWKRIGLGDALLADVAFADARRGVLVALDRIWTTKDGGENWKPRRRVGMTVLTSAFAGDARHAWVAGWGTQDGAPLVFATEDGGASWRKLRADVPPPASGDLQARQVVAARGDSGVWSRLWLTCAAGVLASRDGGETWELQAVPAGRPQAIAAVGDGHLLTTTEGQPILASADGGDTWLAFGADGFLRQPLVAIAAADVATE